MKQRYSSLEIKIPSSGQPQTRLPNVTAMAWCILNFKTGEILWSKDPNKIQEMASLTKIMTIYACFEAILEYDLNLQDILTVPGIAARTIGTSANLKESDQLTLLDLCYGVMLPSGNDAANTIAYYIGNKILQNKQNQSEEEGPPTVKQCVLQYLSYMNKLAQILRLKNTYFANAHGLNCQKNVSSPLEIGKLTLHCIKKYPQIQIIASTLTYQCTIYNPVNQFSKTIKWINTNVLLTQEGFKGFKTGWTSNAGPCLSILYCKKDFEIVITVFNSRSKETRFSESQRLAIWAEKTYNKKKLYQQINSLQKLNESAFSFKFNACNINNNNNFNNYSTNFQNQNNNSQQPQYKSPKIQKLAMSQSQTINLYQCSSPKTPLQPYALNKLSALPDKIRSNTAIKTQGRIRYIQNQNLEPITPQNKI